MREETVVLENGISELLKLQTALDGFGKKHCLPKKTVQEANLVLEEAIVNIINYAYETKREKHKIFIRFRIENEEIVLNIEDDGKPFDPLGTPEPDLNVPLEEREAGGFGIYLIRKLAKSVSYVRDGAKNILTVKIGIIRDE